jgi:flavin-dependent dehydrogenase
MTEPSGVAATLTLPAAAAASWPVIVIGAGPAGSAAAARLAAAGLRVLLIDSAAMPRAKLCGSCLSPAAMRELASLPGGAPLAPPVLPLERVRLVTAAGAAGLPLPGGGVVSREALDTAGVRRAIAAGAAWLPTTRVATLEPPPAGGSGPVRLRAMPGCAEGMAGEFLTAELVVLATGLGEPVLIGRHAGGEPEGRGGTAVVARDSRIGVGATLASGADGPPKGELVMVVARGGYCGIVRLEDGRLDIAAAVDRDFLVGAGGPAAAVLAIVGGTPSARDRPGFRLDPAALAAATFRGTPPLTRSRPVVADASGRILRIGDAAGYVEPFTGEGMGWALTSARLLAEALEHVNWQDAARERELITAAARYALAHRRQFRSHHARCRRVALVVRRPWLVGGAARLARLAPGLAARVTPLVVGAAGGGSSR